MKEDEIILNCSNLEGGEFWSIYSSKRSFTSKLRKNPYFVLKEEVYFNGKNIGIRGYLPFKALTLRKDLKPLTKAWFSELKLLTHTKLPVLKANGQFPIPGEAFREKNEK